MNLLIKLKNGRVIFRFLFANTQNTAWQCKAAAAKKPQLYRAKTENKSVCKQQCEYK